MFKGAGGYTSTGIPRISKIEIFSSYGAPQSL